MLTLRKAILYTLAWSIMIINTSCSVGRHHQTSKKHADPVCENNVDVNAALQYLYNDEVYYFDSEECLQVFKKNPEKFSMAPGDRHGLFRGKWWVPVMAGVMVVGMGTVMILSGDNH